MEGESGGDFHGIWNEAWARGCGRGGGKMTMDEVGIFRHCWSVFPPPPRVTALGIGRGPWVETATRQCEDVEGWGDGG